MSLENINQKNTATQNEQQCDKRAVVNKILLVLKSYDVTISDAREILRAVEKSMYKQKVL